jgi:adenosylcobinamide-GDP ribazoletransferase
MRGFLDAGRYLTAIPLPGGGTPGDLGRVAIWLPVVGLVIGLVLAIAERAAGLVLPPAVAAAAVVALWAALTGGLHLDGVADACDGLGGGFTREEALAIMRDPGVGAYGVIGVVLVLVAKVATLAALPDALRWRALVVAPVLGRLGPLLMVRLCPPARADGAGHALAGGVGARAVAGGGGIAALVAGALLGPWGALPLVLAAAAAGGGARYLRRRLGGATGDTLGALVEVTEVLVLGGVAGLAHRRLL